ncbi:alginate export family protein [Pseudomonas sp. HR96]|uniref:alginate export family protein n=1 Tax=Pseudomonas sp. HR96 TaxID=1027966 RepID=UPI002A74C4E7|nr:alginate export family protein [Pseudomonas sp. HR96]WPP00743.1 alginate export family protein [Pseudomonas sp. HR96]
MKWNRWMMAGIGLNVAAMWACPSLAANYSDQGGDSKTFGLEAKATGEAEGDRDLGTRGGGEVNGIGIDLRPWAYGQWGNWSGYAMGQLVTATDTIQTDPLDSPANNPDAKGQNISHNRDASDTYLALRELWVGYSGLTPYPGEILKFGRQRLRNDDGEWRDNYIEALNWDFDTTLLQTHLGAAERFSDYRTDYSQLSPTDKDRLHVYGDVYYQWLPGQWAGLRMHHVHDDGDLARQGHLMDDLDKTRNGNLTWLGLDLNSDAYDFHNSHTLNYWGSLTWVTGHQDQNHPTVGADGYLRAGAKDGSDVDGWATDLGLRVHVASEWQVGAAYSQASRNYQQNGLQSNRSNWTGTRSRVARYGEAYQPDMANVESAALFTTWRLREDDDASLIYYKFRRVDGDSAIGSSGIDPAADSSGDVSANSLSTLPLRDGSHDLGQEMDVVLTHYFKEGPLLASSAYPSFDDPSALVRLRAGIFKAGDAYGSGVDTYMHRAIVDLVWRF